MFKMVIYHLSLLIQTINLQISSPNLSMRRDYFLSNMILAWLMVLVCLDCMFNYWIDWWTVLIPYFSCEIMLRLSVTLIIDYIDFDLNIFLKFFIENISKNYSSSSTKLFFFVCSSVSVWFIFSIVLVYKLAAISLYF